MMMMDCHHSTSATLPSLPSITKPTYRLSHPHPSSDDAHLGEFSPLCTILTTRAAFRLLFYIYIYVQTIVPTTLSDNQPMSCPVYIASPFSTCLLLLQHHLVHISSVLCATYGVALPLYLEHLHCGPVPH